MPFTLFLLVNVVLIVRPTEVFSFLENLPIYNVIILAALAASAGPILAQFSRAALAARPITVCVFGLLVAIVLSLAANGMVAEGVASGVEFGKTVLYYLLLIANLRTPRHMRLFLFAVCWLMAVQVTIALLQHFEYIHVESMWAPTGTELDPQTGEVRVTKRLYGVGIFHDPNDLCVLMVLGVVCILYLVSERSMGAVRFTALIPLGVFLGAIPLTGSRGGMLTLLAAFGALLVHRFGAVRGGLLMAMAVPVVLLTVGGRAAKFDLDNRDDTSQHRLRHWSDGLNALRNSPVFGIGKGLYLEVADAVAHNSYAETYTELGLFGGTLFSGAFVYAAWALVRVGRRRSPHVDPSLARLRPFLLAIVLASMVGMVSLSRNYTVTTYLILGIVTAYLRLVSPTVPRAVPPLTVALALRWGALSVMFLVAMSVVTARMVQR